MRWMNCSPSLLTQLVSSRVVLHLGQREDIRKVVMGGGVKGEGEQTGLLVSLREVE